MRVLLADDCPDNRESLARLLRAWGHEVHATHDGPSALEAFRSVQPQAVILDIAMPGMTGWDVARQLRQEANGTALLLVALTGHGRCEDQDRSDQAGFDIHLNKPPDLAQLRRLLVAGPT